MRIALFCLLAAVSAGAQPNTPGIEYAVPAPAQPFASDPAVIWYESFDSPDALKSYMDTVPHPELFGISTGQALGGTGSSLRATFRERTVNAGSFGVTFGDSPLSDIQARRGERFDEIYWRLYVKHERGWTRFSG